MRSMTIDALRAGWRALARHLRYAGRDPRKLLWIGRRVVEIIRSGRVGGVLARHRVVQDLSAHYTDWVRQEAAIAPVRRARLLARQSMWLHRPRFSVLLPVYAPRQSLLDAAIASVVAQTYGDWELCVVDDGSADQSHVASLRHYAADARVKVRVRTGNGGIAVATNDALDMASGDYVVFLDQDDLLAVDALLEFADAAHDDPEAAMLFADEDRITDDGTRSHPFFKPGFDAEWLLTTNCVLHPLVVRTNTLRELGGLAAGFDGVQDWELVLRLSERLRSDQIRHIPRVLYHWREHGGSTAAAVYEKPGIESAQRRVLEALHRRRGEAATFEMHASSWRIRRTLPRDLPMASIVVPTRDRPELLRRCVDGLRDCTDYPAWECVVVDNGSTDPGALALLDDLRRDARFSVIRQDGAFNYALLCNEGVASCRGSVVVLLNNDVEPMGSEWLGELVVNALRPQIGVVGAMLYYPDRSIQHAGVVLWLNGVADRPYIGFPRGFRGVDNRLSAVHTVTAVITACAAVRTATYTAVGGMDTALPVACNDVDLCLRVARAGYRNIVTPYAELYHRESASRGYHYLGAEAVQESADEAKFRDKWAAVIPRDPTYNPNFVLQGTAFTLAAPSA
jgi:glycosyltransferase involved in cell wall biosynthesis